MKISTSASRKSSSEWEPKNGFYLRKNQCFGIRLCPVSRDTLGDVVFNHVEATMVLRLYGRDRVRQ